MVKKLSGEIMQRKVAARFDGNRRGMYTKTLSRLTVDNLCSWVVTRIEAPCRKTTAIGCKGAASLKPVVQPAMDLAVNISAVAFPLVSP